MTRLQLQTLFQQWVNDPFGGFFDPTTFIQPALNRALFELQKRLVLSGSLWYVKSPPAQALTVQYQQDYVLPTDCLKLNRLTINTDNSTPIPSYLTMYPITLNQVDRYGNLTGTPEAYVETQSKISLYPVPGTSNQTINLWYSYQVPEMTSDSSVPDAPEILHEYIAVLAVIDAKIKDETLETNIKEKQMRYEMMMQQFISDRQEQTPRMVNSMDCDDTWVVY